MQPATPEVAAVNPRRCPGAGEDCRRADAGLQYLCVAFVGHVEDDAMRDVLAALLELQELEIILEESRIVHGSVHLASAAQVETRVQRLRQTLPPQRLRRFDALRRVGPAVVHERGGTCNGCHLNVPRGDLNRMRRAEVEWVCPNCGRYLMLTD
jgi:hypothetical protein